MSRAKSVDTNTPRKIASDWELDCKRNFIEKIEAENLDVAVKIILMEGTLGKNNSQNTRSA
jgi:hypothetical protein